MTLNSVLVGSSYPTYNLVAGESPIQISIKLRNNGDEVWYKEWHPDFPFNPETGEQPWYRRCYLEPYNQIAKDFTNIPAEFVANKAYGIKLNKTTYTNTNYNRQNENEFVFTINTPSTAGSYNLQYRMVRQNMLATGPSQWQWEYHSFGEIVNVRITALPRPSSSVVEFTFPESLELAERKTVILTLKNTGVWTWDSNFRLEAYNDDALKFSKSYFYIPIGVTVQPNEEYTFRIPVRGAETAGNYHPCYRMYWVRANHFGAPACKNVEVTMPDKPIQNLNDYRWISMSARRSAADIAWQYDVQLSGTDKPPVFGKLIHEEDGHCALYGEPTEYSIDYDYPSITTSVACYSYGYFLNNRAPWFLRQSRAGVDIFPYQLSDANIPTRQNRFEKIDTYENPTDYIKRMLFFIDNATGKIDTTRAGPFGLWGTDTGDKPTIRPVPNWGIMRYTGSDGKQYMDQTGIPSGVTLTRNTKFVEYHPSQEEPGQVEKKQFMFDGIKIIDILDEIAKHCNMIYHTRFVKVNDVWREYLYWIPKYGVQLGWLGVSTTPIEITPTASGLVGTPGLSASIVLEQSYNCVWVEACRKKDSAWFYAMAAGRGVIAGTEVQRALYYRSYDLLPDPKNNIWSSPPHPALNFGPYGVSYGTSAEDSACQDIVNKKALQLVELLDYRIPTYTCTFKSRYFELYQILIFNGFAGLSEFNGFEMQIIDIEYNYESADNGGHSVTITCAPRDELQKSGKFQSVIDEIQENYDKMKQDIEGGRTEDKVAVIISTYDEGAMCNAQLRSTGAHIKTRAYGYRTASG